LPAESPGASGLPPGTAVAEINPISGPDRAPLVIKGSTITQPLTSGTITAAGGPTHGPTTGGTGNGGGEVVPPDPATQIDWNVVIEPEASRQGMGRVPISCGRTAAPVIGFKIPGVAGCS
jgi:hypothetical protein